MPGKDGAHGAHGTDGAHGTRPGGSFAGKVAIVTGGGSGIGAALVRALMARGAAVVIADTDEAGAGSVAESVTAGAAGSAPRRSTSGTRPPSPTWCTRSLPSTAAWT